MSNNLTCRQSCGNVPALPRCFSECRGLGGPTKGRREVNAMNFAFSSEEKKLQADVQEFISCHFTDEVKKEFDEEKTGTNLVPKAKAFLKKISERGWFAV